MERYNASRNEGEIGNFQIMQLFPNAPADLTNPTTLAKSEEEFLEILKKAMVVRPNILRARQEWDQLRQMSDETASAYRERVMACKEECQFRVKVDDKIIDVSDIFTYTKLFTGLHNPEMKTKIKTCETMTKEDWDLEMDAEKMYTTIIDVDFNMREHHTQEHDARASKATSEYAQQKKFGKYKKPARQQQQIRIRIREKQLPCVQENRQT